MCISAVEISVPVTPCTRYKAHSSVRCFLLPFPYRVLQDWLTSPKCTSTVSMSTAESKQQLINDATGCDAVWWQASLQQGDVVGNTCARGTSSCKFSSGCLWWSAVIQQSHGRGGGASKCSEEGERGDNTCQGHRWMSKSTGDRTVVSGVRVNPTKGVYCKTEKQGSWSL